MPGAENLLVKYVYSTPENIYCNSPLGRYWCGIRYSEHTMGVFAGFTYPRVSAGDQAKIYTCAIEAGIAATPPIALAIAGCEITGGLACVEAVALAIPAANEILRTAFFRCLREQQTLPEEIVSQCDIGIYQKSLDFSALLAGIQSSSMDQLQPIHSHGDCLVCCKGITGEYVCKPLGPGTQIFGRWDEGVTSMQSNTSSQSSDDEVAHCKICCKGFTGQYICWPVV
ncbi:hypothetical protein [Paenibacillus terrae]|uniref:Uncharacterized protein n=1 Tax=Paenibacillus terrae TaxID=159743 RepID=A0A0D7WV12_9BACL|nr:hypothetical protein [Paenibacillus terrae]KJD43010.1 hypothetical protein QD47_24925 [Paenibacillus terrae]